MTPEVYQQLAARTICPQDKALERIIIGGPPLAQLLHSVIGMMGELGEICSLLQKVYWYGKPMSQEELLKQLNLEFGDLLWYHSEGLSAIKAKLNQVMEDNITKLQVRYPEKYTDFHAADENRDRTKEEAHVQDCLNRAAAVEGIPCRKWPPGTVLDKHGVPVTDRPADNQNPSDGPT